MSSPKNSIRLFLLTLTFLLTTLSSPLVHAEEKAKKPKVDDRAPITGEILEKIDASSYSYLRLKTPKEKAGVWVAVPQIDIKLHKTVTVGRPIPMFGFESKVLKRKFERIYFGVLEEQRDEIVEGSRGHWIPGSKKVDEAAAMGPAHKNEKLEVDLSQIKLKKAEADDAVTISELFSKKDKLSSQIVQIRGKVIKYNANIMGKNWIHIADGTGSLNDKNYEVTVITPDTAQLGEIIVVTGKVTLDKKVDPYFFPIALEDAQLKKK